MNSTTPFATYEKTSEETIQWVIRRLEAIQLRVTRTFDMQQARLAHPNCSCPHHGDEACTCQLNVLLIYQSGYPPASLIIHSYERTTGLYLVDTPAQPVDHQLSLLIRENLAQPTQTISRVDHCHTQELP